MSNIDVGLDVHQETITVAVLPAAALAPTRVEQLPNDLPRLQRYLARLARDGAVQVCYEASGAGYVLHRAVTALGVPLRRDCPVIDSHQARRPAET